MCNNAHYKNALSTKLTNIFLCLFSIVTPVIVINFRFDIIAEQRFSIILGHNDTKCDQI